MDTQQPQPLVCPKHTSHYFFIFIITIVIGGALGASYGYQKGFDTAKKLVEQSSIAPMLLSPEEIRSLSGTVSSVSGNTITLHVQSMNPFEDQNLLERTVTVTSDTKITKLTQKDPAVFQAEMSALATASQSPSGLPPTPPAPYISTSITVADIKAGDAIVVSAAENIKSSKDFSATEINIQPTFNAGII